MAEHDWRELLDDPEVENVVNRVFAGIGRRYYASSNSTLALDDLESWLWDEAVRVAESYPGPPPNAYDPPRHFHANLYRNLAGAITNGWHYSDYAGARNSARRNATTHTTSLDAELEDGHRRTEELGALGTRRAAANDPIAILMRAERLEHAIHRAEHQAAHGTFHTETSPYCSENLCLQPTFAGGLCSKHYSRQRQAWGDTCTVDGCTNGVRATGLCSTHYTAHRKASPNAATCSHQDCTKTVNARGLCATHYNQERQANAETWAAERQAKSTTCTHPGCDRTPRAKGLCDTHYTALKRARRKERDHHT